MSRSMTPEEIEEKIVRFLKAVGLYGVAHLDLMTLIVKMKNYLPGFNYRRVADGELPNAEGMYDPGTRLLLIPESVFASMNRDIPRDRFSVAHELAHAILGHKNIRFRHTELQAYEKAKPSIRREEFQANQGAAFLLAPSELACDCKTVDEIQARFMLSRTAAEHRKRDLEAYSRRKTGGKRPLPSSISDFLREQKRRGFDVRSLDDDDKK